jgi:hypothetical protein
MRRRLALAAIAAAAVYAITAPGASAGTVTKTLNFPLSGSSSTNIFNQSFSCCDINIGDPIDYSGNIHGSLSLDMATALNAPTHNDLTYTDTNLRQGRTLDLKNTFNKDAGSMNVNYTLGVDLNVYGLDFNPTKSAGDTLPCGVPLLADSCSHAADIPIASFTILDVGVAYAEVNVDAQITTTAHISGDGVSTQRTMSSSGVPLLGPDTLTFTSSPQAKDESTHLSCSVPAGEQVNYAMGDESSHVNGNVDEGVGIAVGGDVKARDPFGPDFTLFSIGPFGFNLFTLPAITFNQINLGAPAQNVDLGVLQKNNIPPQISGPIISSGTMKEGDDTTFHVNATSPCGKDSLDYKWEFSNPNSIEPMVAYGETAHIVFPDNGIYEGRVIVTDPTGLSTTKDLDPVTITNANPSVNTPSTAAAEWGDVIKYHADAVDRGSADQSSLSYSWSFGDGSTARGQDVKHVFGAPGVYAGSVAANDKDGGAGTAAFATSIAKRATKLVYTGSTAALTNTSPTLSATLVDDHGQPVNGGSVSFSLGAQSVGMLANSAGLVSLAVPLNQIGDANYPLTAIYLGDSKYLGSADGATFRINKRKTSTAYVGDLLGNPNKLVVLAAKVTDELGQPEVGAAVTFTVGSQTASAVTDSTGLASAPLTLNQNPGTYVLNVTTAANGFYLGSASGPLTFKIPSGNGVLSAIAASLSATPASGGSAKAIRRLVKIQALKKIRTHHRVTHKARKRT